MNRPISLHDTNPHYFVYKEKPTILIASGEHYGAVLNRAFDFRKYLEELHGCGNNVTRIFAGMQREFPGVFYDAYNTLAPKPKDFLCPFGRSEVNGCNDSLKKFNLDVWDEAFFRRLDAFMAEAASLDIVVEFAFFCPFYKETLGNATWNLSPFHPDNNINGIGAAGLEALFQWKDEGFIRYQTAMVRKLVEFLNPHDNLMFEIMNEPYYGDVSSDFEAAIAKVVSDTEKDLPKQHLVTQNISNGWSEITTPDLSVSVFNFHYATPPHAVEVNYGLNKPIGCNETGMFTDSLDITYRRQAWEFMLAGGALFNNLDFSFAVGNEEGSGVSRHAGTGGSHALREQYGFLKKFLDEMEFVSMHPSNALMHTVPGASASGRLLAEPGRQYAYYAGITTLPDIGFVLEPCTYLFEVFDPEKCIAIGEWVSAHDGGMWHLPLDRCNPRSTMEIVVRVTAVR